jgi:hypothetical protein
MPYIIEKLEQKMMDAVSKPESWIERNPAYVDFYNEIAEMRNPHEEAGTHITKSEWKHVARLQTPLEDAQRVVNPEFLKNKRGFYAWLDRNPQYCTYDRRKGRRS